MKQFGTRSPLYLLGWCPITCITSNMSLEALYNDGKGMRVWRGIGAKEWYNQQVTAPMPQRFHCRG